VETCDVTEFPDNCDEIQYLMVSRRKSITSFFVLGNLTGTATPCYIKRPLEMAT